jgi:hypothetical protein
VHQLDSLRRAVSRFVVPRFCSTKWVRMMKSLELQFAIQAWFLVLLRFFVLTLTSVYSLDLLPTRTSPSYDKHSGASNVAFCQWLKTSDEQWLSSSLAQPPSSTSHLSITTLPPMEHNHEPETLIKYDHAGQLQALAKRRKTTGYDDTSMLVLPSPPCTKDGGTPRATFPTPGDITTATSYNYNENNYKNDTSCEPTPLSKITSMSSSSSPYWNIQTPDGSHNDNNSTNNLGWAADDLFFLLEDSPDDNDTINNCDGALRVTAPFSTITTTTLGQGQRKRAISPQFVQGVVDNVLTELGEADTDLLLDNSLLLGPFILLDQRQQQQQHQSQDSCPFHPLYQPMLPLVRHYHQVPQQKQQASAFPRKEPPSPNRSCTNKTKAGFMIYEPDTNSSRKSPLPSPTWLPTIPQPSPLSSPSSCSSLKPPSSPLRLPSLQLLPRPKLVISSVEPQPMPSQPRIMAPYRTMTTPAPSSGTAKQTGTTIPPQLLPSMLPSLVGMDHKSGTDMDIISELKSSERPMYVDTLL